MKERRPPRWQGIGAYVALTFVCAWASTLLVDRVWDGVGGMFPTRLLAVSVHYWLTMGWPPLLAVLVIRRWIDPPEPLDLGLAPSGRGVLFLGGLAAASVAALAMMLTVLGEALHLALAAAAPSVDSPAPSGPSVEAATILGIAFVMTVALLWGQAFVEELGWRGYLLPRMMQSLGPWPGLLVHGLVWGMWYAPVVALAAGDPTSTPARGVAFVVTGTLLGTILGWLRLAQSLSLAVVFNVVLTVAAGLPFILRGVDVGPRGAVYGPAGWIPLLVVTGILFIAPTRRAVRTPPAIATHPRGPTTVRRLVGVGASRNGNHVP